jgi:diadenylate cyclase
VRAHLEALRSLLSRAAQILVGIFAVAVGALIVLERDIGLRTFIESDVRLDSQISRDLLLSIFLPGTALHDAVVPKRVLCASTDCRVEC